MGAVAVGASTATRLSPETATSVGNSMAVSAGTIAFSGTRVASVIGSLFDSGVSGAITGSSVGEAGTSLATFAIALALTISSAMFAEGVVEAEVDSTGAGMLVAGMASATTSVSAAGVVVSVGGILAGSGDASTC